MEGDADLEAIRAKRMAELQQQMGGAGPGGQGPSQEQQEQMRRDQQEAKNHMLTQVLTQEARARLNMIAMTKPEKGQMVENMLINMARSGQIQGKLGEEQLKGLLARVSEQTQKITTVKFDRRRAQLDSDEDY